jgi:hypothetical protein
MPSLQTAMRFILRNRAYEVYESARVPDGPGRRVLRIARNIASHLPQHQRVFARDFLTPWREFGLPNMVFLRKTGEDNRDWRYHNPF